MKYFQLNILVLSFVIQLISIEKYNAQQISLIYPQNNSFLFNSTNNFIWNQDYPFVESTYYILEISTDKSFSNIVYTSSNLSITNDIVDIPFGIYYWRVKIKREELTFFLYSNVQQINVFDILSLEGLSVFLRADSGVLVDNDNHIIEWKNLIDQSNNAIQFISENRPLYINSVDTLNGQATIYFDGDDDMLTIENPVGIIELYSLLNWAGNNTFSTYNGALTAKTQKILFIGNKDTQELYSLGDFSENIFINGNNSLDFYPMSQFKIVSGRRELNLLLDGILIGRDRTNIDRHWNGNISEVIGFNQIITESSRAIINSYFQFKYSPGVNLGFDIVLSQYCDSAIVSASSQFNSYLWSTGSTDSVITVYEPGKYWLDVVDVFGFASSDTIMVVPPGNYIKSFQLCQYQDSIWNTQLDKQNHSFLWQDGSTDSLMVISEPGEYYVTITSSLGCSFSTDTVVVTTNTYSSTTSLPSNPTLCQNGPLSLITGAEETVSYQWFNTDSPTITISTDAEIFPTESGWYWVEAINEIGCVAMDSSFVTYFGDIPSPLPGFEWGLACEKDAVQFADTTVWEQSPITGWEWSTDSGQSSTEQNPQFVFETWGEHVITLMVENEAGCQAFIKDTVKVHPKPVVNFCLAQNLCTNTSLFFTDSTTIAEGGLGGWSWQFDGDTVVSDTNFVIYEFQSDGEHSLLQIVTSDSGCTDTLLSTFPLRNSPVGSFVADTVCFGYPVTAMANSDTSGVGPTIFEWRDGQGNYLGGFPELSIATGEGTDYNQGGQYGLDLMVHTADLFCADTTFGSFSLEEPPDIQVISEQSCIGEAVVLEGLISGVTTQVITSWSWLLEDGTTGSDSVISFTPLDTGYVSYQLITQTQIAGCESIIYDSIFVYGFPHAQIQAEAAPCINTETILKAIGNDTSDYAELIFHWEIAGEDFPVQDTLIMPVFIDPGEVIVGLTVTNNGNCASYDQLDFYTVFGAQADFTASQVCAGELTELTALPDTLYSGPTQSEWFLANDTLFGHNVAVDFGGGGFYDVINQITDTQHGCIDWDTALVKVSDLPIALYAPYAGCVGDAFTLVSFSEFGNDPIDFTKWSSSFGQTVGQTLALQIDEPGVYPISLVVITEEAGCIDTLTLDQTINSRPEPAFTFSPESGQPPLEVNFNNHTIEADNYSWSFGTGDVSFDPEPTYTYLDTGWFTISLNAINQFGCTNIKSDSILINPPRVDIEIVDIIPEWNGQFLTVRSLVLNNGYYTVTEFETYISIGSGTPVKTLEMIDIERSLAVLTEPSTAFYVDKNTQAFVCVELKLPGGVKDENPNNDKLCKTLSENEFEVYAPFPNPTTNKLSTRLILPEDGEFSIEIYSSEGKMVKGLTFNGGQGFNQVDLYVADLRAGNYRMKVIYGNEVKVFSWVKG